MDHAYIEAHDIVEAYLADRLSEEERDAFEAHYFACATCFERLEAANDLREGMRQVAAEDLAQAAAVRVRLGLLASLAALSRRHRLALAGAFLLLAALPSLWLVARDLSLERRLATTVAGATDKERQRAALESRLHGLERAGAGDRQRLEAELAQARQAHEAAVQPQVNVPLFLLASVRSGESPGREPVNQISLSPTAGSLILTAELATVDFPSYRASLRTGDGKEIWQAKGLRPDHRDTLVLLLPARLLPPGLYRLAIEGAKNDGTGSGVEAYPFRVRRP